MKSYVRKWYEEDAKKWLRGDVVTSSPNRFLPVNLVLRAVREGRISVLKWLHAIDSLDVKVKYAYGRRKAIKSVALVATAEGRLSVLQWLYSSLGKLYTEEEKDKLGRNVALVAADGGKIEILMWLFTLRLLEWDDYRAAICLHRSRIDTAVAVLD